MNGKAEARGLYMEECGRGEMEDGIEGGHLEWQWCGVILGQLQEKHQKTKVP